MRWMSRVFSRSMGSFCNSFQNTSHWSLGKAKRHPSTPRIIIKVFSAFSATAFLRMAGIEILPLSSILMPSNVPNNVAILIINLGIFDTTPHSFPFHTTNISNLFKWCQDFFTYKHNKINDLDTSTLLWFPFLNNQGQGDSGFTQGKIPETHPCKAQPRVQPVLKKRGRGEPGTDRPLARRLHQIPAGHKRRGITERIFPVFT